MKKIIAAFLISVTVITNSIGAYAKNIDNVQITENLIEKNETSDIFNKKLKETVGHDSSVDKDTFIKYKFCGTKIGLYGFDEDITRGAVSLKNLQNSSPTVLDYEAFYGLTAYTKGSRLYVKAYNHSKEHQISGSVVVSDKNDTSAINIGYNKYTIIECKNFSNGLYCVRTSFDTMDMDLYFYVNDDGVYTVRTTEEYNLDNLKERKEYVNKLVKNARVTPEECLYNGDIVYPCKDGNGTRCDTDEWINLSHEILDGHEDWSDEFKVFALTNWMIENIRYDDWRYRTGKGSRAKQYGVWDGTYSMWDMKVGVCCDFSNVMVIMLREHGIPVTSFESDTHMWNLVYIDDEWQELDITTIMPYHSTTFEADDCNNLKCNYKDYLSYGKYTKVVSVGHDIWTMERAYGK